MSAYKNDLHITSRDSDERIKLASDVLTNGTGVVVIDGAIALSPKKTASSVKSFPVRLLHTSVLKIYKHQPRQ